MGGNEDSPPLDPPWRRAAQTGHRHRAPSPAAGTCCAPPAARTTLRRPCRGGCSPAPCLHSSAAPARRPSHRPPCGTAPAGTPWRPASACRSPPGAARARPWSPAPFRSARPSPDPPRAGRSTSASTTPRRGCRGPPPGRRRRGAPATAGPRRQSRCGSVRATASRPGSAGGSAARGAAHSRGCRWTRCSRRWRREARPAGC